MEGFLCCKFAVEIEQRSIFSHLNGADLTADYYRPQQSWKNVMFSPVSASSYFNCCTPSSQHITVSASSYTSIAVHHQVST